MSCCFGICVSRDKESDMKLNSPRICCEYRAASLFINSLANHLAVLSCAGCDVLNLVERSYPKALELSVKTSIFCGVVAYFNVRWMVMAAARNSSRLMECSPIISGGMV